MNEGLRRRRSRRDIPPPVLLFPEETDIAPTRLQPRVDPDPHFRHPPNLPLDLRDLEEQERLRSPYVLQPRLPEPEQEYFIPYRHLLPRRYRYFLRHSPYPRLLLGITMGAMAVLGGLWVSRIQQAEASAAGSYRVARSLSHTELDTATDYGVDPHLLRRLYSRSRYLDSFSAPSDFLLGRARLQFYQDQEHRYRSLLRTVRRLERRALAYWTQQEHGAYDALVRATIRARSQGLSLHLPSVPACTTPRCLRVWATSQWALTRRLRRTSATLDTYAHDIAASADTATAAQLELQQARLLRALLPAGDVSPVSGAALDSAYAGANNSAGFARVGALGRLDVDALQAALVRSLPPSAILVSLENQTLTCYRHGTVVCRFLISAGSQTPTGIFHIGLKELSVEVPYWSRSRFSLRYRPGVLPYWMSFSGTVALQGAPWRSIFGPGSDAVTPPQSPSTPGSVDLPPSAAAMLFHWASVGTEVAVY